MSITDQVLEQPELDIFLSAGLAQVVPRHTHIQSVHLHIFKTRHKTHLQLATQSNHIQLTYTERKEAESTR